MLEKYILRSTEEEAPVLFNISNNNNYYEIEDKTFKAKGWEPGKKKERRNLGKDNKNKPTGKKKTELN